MRLLGIVFVIGVLFVFGYASMDLPDRGAADAPASRHLSPDLVERTAEEVEIPNVVSAVLADFRSYDTLGETVVIFTAGMAVLVVLQRGYRRDDGSS